jgi:hypothetical protein
VPFDGTIVNMMIVGDLLYLAVFTATGREDWSTPDGVNFTRSTPEEMLALARELMVAYRARNPAPSPAMP